MVSVKAILTSPRSYAILAAAGAITAFTFPEYYDGLLLGGSLYPLGMFQRSIIAMMAGVITALVSFALYIFFTSMWEGRFGSPRPARTPRGKGEGGESYGGGSYGGGLGQTVETAAVASPVVNGWAGEGHTAGGETGAFGACADGVSEGGDCGGSESDGGGDYGGGGDFG
ncbi:MAG: hypothetical protein LC803_10935, partial [Acidobacteria bacterium]|nr:hypothetical protein [Acidobacteriota bacterium]